MTKAPGLWGCTVIWLATLSTVVQGEVALDGMVFATVNKFSVLTAYTGWLRAVVNGTAVLTDRATMATLHTPHVHLTYGEDCIYEGAVSAGRWHGQGSARLLTSHVYAGQEGSWVQGGLTGHGTILWASGARYIGDVLQGLRHGLRGYMEYDRNHTRLSYTGSWRANHPHGSGVARWRTGDYYTGEWVDNKRHGPGAYVWVDGRVANCTWVHHKCQGLGYMRRSPSGPPQYDFFIDNEPQMFFQTYCATGSVSQMKALKLALSQIPVEHRGAVLDMCERQATGLFWSNENVLTVLRHGIARDDL